MAAALELVRGGGRPRSHREGRSTGFQRASFECRQTIRAPRARIHAELATPERQLGLQPLLVEVHPRADGRGFEAVERVPLVGALAFRNRIQVEVEAFEPPARIGLRAHSGSLQVRSEFQLRPSEADAGATDVLERVELSIPVWWRPLRRFVLRRAVQAQQGLLENLRRRMEEPEVAPPCEKTT